MAMYSYRDGSLRATVSTSTVCHPFNNATAVAFMNKVFSTWHHDMNACKPKSRAAALRTLEAMGRTAGAFSRANPMIRIKDLWHAFDPFDRNNKPWRDANEWSYHGGSFGGFQSSLPWALVTFAKAYDENLNTIAALVEKQKAQATKIVSLLAGKNFIPWRELNDPLKKFDEATKAIDPLMVMCPEGLGKKGFSWTKTIASYTGVIDDVLKETAASGSVNQAVASQALAFIVGKCIPVFGELYAEALEGLPTAIRFFEDIKWQRNHELAKFGKDYMIYDR